MANYRRGRVNERIREEMTDIITKVKDPRVSEAFISITMADCTADLKYCKIFYSVIGGSEVEAETQKGLESATGFIRTQLAHRLDMRQTPELKFILDDSMKNGAHISDLLRQIKDEQDAKDAAAPAEENSGNE